MIWQSGDGTWSRGFYEVVGELENGQPEYGEDFACVLVGCYSLLNARDAWTGDDPGGFDVVRYGSFPLQSRRLSAMAALLINEGENRHGWYWKKGAEL